MPQQHVEVDDASQRVQEPGVAHIDTWRLYQTLPAVPRPRQQLSDHEQLGQHVQVMSDGVATQAETSGETGRIQWIALAMR